MPEAAATAGPELQLDLQQPEQHLVRCRLRFTPRTHRLGFRLPSWTPGSYLIRDYVRHLEGLEVWQDGRRVALEGAAPTGWHLQFETLAPVEIRYRILATDLSVRTCHLNGDHGFLALAGVALQLEGERWTPHGLELLLPPEWQPFVPLDEAGPMRWQARDFDQLVDTPLEEAFSLRRGVCQDFTHIQICALRSLGIPAGYVSGFLRTFPPPGQPRLEGADAMHAWVRAWVGKQVGWIEFDPTNDQFAGTDYIIIGHGRDYGDVAPVKGAVRSAGGHRTQQAVDVIPLEDAPA